jgi:hypothetical protein
VYLPGSGEPPHPYPRADRGPRCRPFAYPSLSGATGRTVTESGAAGGATTTIADALQTSAAINGGNSGGALVNLSCQVIGIPTAAARDPEAGSAPGIGFAIPSDTVTSIAGQLISTGEVTQSGRAALGVAAHGAVTPDGQPAGVTIAAVTGGGPAAAAGLRAGDVIHRPRRPADAHPGHPHRRPGHPEAGPAGHGDLHPLRRRAHGEGHPGQPRQLS